MVETHTKEPLSADMRAELFLELETLEPLIFELLTQSELERVCQLYDDWVARLGDGPAAARVCNALDGFIDACIEDGDAERAYLNVVDAIHKGGA